MSEVVTQILAHVDCLSQQERAELAYAFLCSLEPEEVKPVFFHREAEAEIVAAIAHQRRRPGYWENRTAE